MRRKGLALRSEILGLERVVANKSAVKYLSVSENTELWQLRRLRIASDEPIMLETSWLPVEMCSGLTTEDKSENTLYGVLSEKYGIYLIRVEELFEPVLTDAYEATLLTVEKGSPALLVHRIAYTYEEKPVELCKSIVRGDRCRYYVNLKRTKR